MNFDETPQSGDPRDPFPEGWTACMIEHAQDGESKTSGKPMTTVTYKLAQPDSHGNFTFKKAWGYFVWSNASQVALLKKLCEAVGVPTTGRVSPERLIGKKLEVYVKIEMDDTGKYRPKNIVTGFRSPQSHAPQKVAPEPEPPDDDIPF